MYVDLLWFFLDESATSEDFGALHGAITYQGRWGEVKSTTFEEIWGARVHWNEYGSLLLCYEYSWFVQVHFDLSSRELQLLILDILSYLRTWIFICPVTFNKCELDLQNLRTCGIIFQLQKPRPLKQGSAPARKTRGWLVGGCHPCLCFGGSVCGYIPDTRVNFCGCRVTPRVGYVYSTIT